MTQTNLWQTQPDSLFFSELCSALYQREVSLLAKGEFSDCFVLQARLKSLPHYILKTAHAMLNIDRLQLAPLILDSQNASWSARQANNIPLSGQEDEVIYQWYLSNDLNVGLVVPILSKSTIILDCIDRTDIINRRIRTNVAGWFSLAVQDNQSDNKDDLVIGKRLLKPNKKVMIAACAGHSWQAGTKITPVMPSLRELLLSCSVNWKNFKKAAVI